MCSKEEATKTSRSAGAGQVRAPLTPQTRPTEARPTLAEVLRGYTDYLMTQGRSQHTVSSTRLDLLQLGRFLGHQPLESVTTQDLQAFFAWLRRQHGNGTSSLRRKTSTVKRFFQFVYASGLHVDDPSATIRYPAVEPRAPRPLTPAETAAIIEAAMNPAWAALIGCLLDCGLKRDELVALRWDDVDLDATPPPGLLHVRHRAASQRARRRTLALTDRLAGALATLRQQGGHEGAVFDLSARGVDFIVETCARRGGVRPREKVTPQMLRDAYACKRVRAFLVIERTDADDPDAHADTIRDHDQTLLRELGLSDHSGAASRYRHLVAGTEAYRTE